MTTKKFGFFSKLTSHSNPAKELTKHIKSLIELSNQITSEQSTHNKKKLEKINETLTQIIKQISKTNFTNDVFESIISSNLIKTLSDIVGRKISSLTSVVFPFISKILFENEENLTSINLNEEILLMNVQCIMSIKSLIKTFIDIAIDRNEIDIIEKYVVPFTNILLNKFIFYPNFYYAISSPNNPDDQNSNTFDSNLFELIIQLFALEFKYNSRETKANIRKSLMKCLNLYNFYTVNVSLIERLLEILIENLRSYYENFVLFDIGKYLQMNKNIPKGASGEDLSLITKDDTICYLKFFSMITHCFAKSDLKAYLSNMLFNNFFCVCLQRDIIALASNMVFDGKTTKILEFIYYITVHVTNYEICEILFYFLFGFNYYNVTMGNDDDEYIKGQEGNNSGGSDDNNMIRNLIGDDLDEDDINEIFHNNNTNNPGNTRISTNRLKDEVKKYLRGNTSNIATFSANVNLNIEKTNHNFESIIAYFTLIMESNNTTNKSLLLSFLANLARNVSYVFMTELVVPYYLNSICNVYPKSFDSLCETMKSSRDKIDIVETLKAIHPKNFSINSSAWMDYFTSNLEENYIRNINMLNRINTVNLNPNNNDPNGSMFSSANGNFLTIHNMTTFNDTYSVLTTTTNRENTKEADIEFSPSDNPLNYMLNNYTVNLRIKFYDVLVQNFKKFATNKYIDNLSYVKFFIEICSIPFSVNKGESAEQLYNIFSNVTYAGKKKTKLFKFSLVNIIMKIRNALDEKVQFNFTRDEINKLATFRKNDLNSNNAKNSNDFFDNILLYNELYKVFLSNIFSKACIDQINFGWSKKVVDFNSINFE